MGKQLRRNHVREAGVLVVQHQTYHTSLMPPLLLSIHQAVYVGGFQEHFMTNGLRGGQHLPRRTKYSGVSRACERERRVMPV